MKIRITFECDDDLRRAVAHHYGHEGEASYEDMKAWFRNYGEGCNDDVLCDWEADSEG